ncbi:MAG: hypothetical protein JWO31_1932, partial [Phycisphaerales bacterium]|nr:hypothetical protein [Phycisphaerales bacterium]
AAALAPARPPAGYEDRLTAALRPRLGRRGGRRGMGSAVRGWWDRPLVHPLVRRVAVGAAAAIVVGSVGYGMTVAIDGPGSQAAAGGGERDATAYRGPSPATRPGAGGGGGEGRLMGFPAASDPALPSIKQAAAAGAGWGEGGERWSLPAPQGKPGAVATYFYDANSTLAAAGDRKPGDGTAPVTAPGSGSVGGKGTAADEAGAAVNRGRRSAESGLVDFDALEDGKDDLVKLRGLSASGKKEVATEFFAAPAGQTAPTGAEPEQVARRTLERVAGGKNSAPQSSLPALAGDKLAAVRDRGASAGPSAGGFGGGGGSSAPGRPALSGGVAVNGPVGGAPVSNTASLRDEPALSVQTAAEASKSLSLGTAARADSFGRRGAEKLMEAPPVVLGRAFKPAEALGRPDDGRAKDATSFGLDAAQKGKSEVASEGKGLKDVQRAPADVPRALAEERLGQAAQAGQPARPQQMQQQIQQVQKMQQVVQQVEQPLRQEEARQQKGGQQQSNQLEAEKRPADGPKPPPAVAEPAAPPQAPAPLVRKIIRNGQVTFEVDSFDSAAAQVGKIAGEEGGFISTTDSDKLPNGRVRGSVTVRCPPDRLDTLVLKLRGLGDLKSQKITAEDVTKKYTDTESQLRAARLMESRLLEIIKSGGAVKDLLAAEKELGIWREKLEVLEGEIRYLNAQVSLSTLVVELMERDVRTPTSAAETETVAAGVECEDVEKARADALAAIAHAKGRVVDSDLKKLDGGQFTATIVADVLPDAAGPVIDRLKQLGKVARLDVTRKTTTQGGTGPIVPGLRVERRETRFQISLYNLANVAPRQSTSLNLAAADVEATYRAIGDQVKAAGGRVVSSQLNRPRADQTVGTITFEAPADKADVLLGTVRAGVEVMRLEVTTNPDAQNTTEAKRGFAVQVFSLAYIPAREATTLRIAARNVPAAFAKLLEAAKAGGGRVITSALNEQDPTNIDGTLEFEVTREKWAPIDAALTEAGLLVSRTVARSADSENTVDSKVRLSVALFDDAKLAPRETVSAVVATRTVQEAHAAIAAAAREAGARTVGAVLNLQDKANPSGTLTFAVPREAAARVEAALRAGGLLVSRNSNRQPDGPMNVESKVGFSVEVVDERGLSARESQAMVVVAPSATARYAVVLEALRVADAQVLRSQLLTRDRVVTGELEFVARRDDLPRLDKALGEGADVFNRTVNRSADTQNTVDTKVRYSVVLRDADQQPPRQTYTLAAET